MEIAYCCNDYSMIEKNLTIQKREINNTERKNESKMSTSFNHALSLGILPTASMTISVERLIGLLFELKDLRTYKINL